MELEPRTSAPAHATGAVAFVDLDEIAEDATFRLREEGDVALLAASIGRLGQLVPIELRPLPGLAVAEDGDGDDDPAGPGPRYQVVAGFRRLAALKLLVRDRVLARIHEELSDDDAWALALVQPLLTEPLDAAGLAALRDRLPEARADGWAEELLAEALVRAPIEPALRDDFFAWLNGDAAPEAAPAPLAGADEDALGDAAAAEPDEATSPGPGPALDVAAAAVVADLEPVEVDLGVEPEGPLEVTPEELVADLERRLYEVNADLALAVDAWADLPAAGRRAIAAQARWIAGVLPLLEDDAGQPGDEDDR